MDIVKKDEHGEDRLARIERDILEIRAAVDRILRFVGPAATASVGVTVTLPSGQTQSGDQVAQLTDLQSVTFSLAPVDSKGQPSTIDPTKTVLAPDNAAVATVTVNPDGVTGTIVGLTVGSTQLTGSVTDATDPADVVAIAPISIAVVSSATATVGVNLGTPFAT